MFGRTVSAVCAIALICAVLAFAGLPSTAADGTAPAAKVTKINFTGYAPLSTMGLTRAMQTKVGSVFSNDILKRDIEAIQKVYQNGGYIAYVTEKVNFDAATGVLTIPILVQRVDSIRFTGLKTVKAKELTDMMQTKPGAYFNTRTLKSDIVRIYNTRKFEDVGQYKVEPGPKAGSVKITIPVVEKS